jgi:hypothetical protein
VRDRANPEPFSAALLAEKWRRRGAGDLVYSSSVSCSASVRLYAGSRRHAGRKVLALSSQIWHRPVVLLLAAMLLWKETEVAGTGASGYSKNKACSGGNSDPSTSEVRLLPPGRHGDRKRRWMAGTTCGESREL